MDIFFVILGFVCVVVGIFGSFLPVLPGPPISWFGILCLYFTSVIDANYWIIAIGCIVAIATIILDYIIPARGTKRFGGSSYGVWGTNIGLIVGIFAPIPLGFIIGPFVGAFVGELLYNSKDQGRALKAATGSFLGFLTSTFMKLVVCASFFGLFVSIVWKNRELLF
jgi:uncharacterized protein YqgC (DUF456 family)